MKDKSAITSRAFWLSLGCAAGLFGSSVSLASPLFGVGTHVIRDADIQERSLSAIVELGGTSEREDAPWSLVEKSPGVLEIPASWDLLVNRALSKSIDVVLILDYGNALYDGGDKPRSSSAIQAFARYASFVAKHFAGRVKTFEIWNEWDNTTGGHPAGSPQDYAALFKVAFAAVKAAVPTATVLLGSGIQKPAFYEVLANLGAVAIADGVSIHPYNYDPEFGPETCAAFLTNFESILTRLSHKESVPLYVTEIGWPTHLGHGQYNETRQAEYAFRTVLLLSSLEFVKGIWWYDLRDDGQDPHNKEHHFGLLHNDWSAKPSFGAFRSAIAIAKSQTLALDTSSPIDQGRVIINARRPDGGSSVLAWNFHKIRPAITLRCGSSNTEIQEPTWYTAAPNCKLERLDQSGAISPSAH